MNEIFDGAGDDVGSQGEAERSEGGAAVGDGEIGLHLSIWLRCLSMVLCV